MSVCECGTLTALEVVGKPAGERLVAGQGSITLPARRRGHGPRHNISDAVPKCAFMGESHGVATEYVWHNASRTYGPHILIIKPTRYTNFSNLFLE